MAGLRPGEIKFRYFDNNGNPLSGGKVWTYVSGTNTPLTTWADINGDANNTNPVILDSRGEANIFLQPGKNYRFTVLTAADALVETEDNIAGASPAAASEWLNAKSFGATGDGVTDDTAAIRAAVVAAVAAPRRTLYFPAGTYKLTDDLPVSSYITVTGDGNNSKLLQTNINKNIFTATGDVTYSSFSLMQWEGAGAGTGGSGMGFAGYTAGPNILVNFDKLNIVQMPQCAIYLPDSFNCSVTNSRIRFCGTVGTIAGGNAEACSDTYGGGIRYARITFVGAASTGNDISNCYIANCGRGVYVDGNDRVVSHTFPNCKIELCYIGIDVDGRGSGIGISRANSLDAGTYFEGNLFAGAMLGEAVINNPYRNNTTAGTGLPGSWSTKGPDGVQFDGRYTENLDSRFTIGNTDGISGSDPILSVDKNSGGQITRALFGTSAIRMVDGSNTYTGQQILSTSGSPTATGRVGSLALDRSTNTYSTLYIKTTGGSTTDAGGWVPMHERRYGATGARPTPGTGAEGALYFNTSFSGYDVWNGSSWSRLNPVSSGLYAAFPSTPVDGDIFYAKDAASLFIFDSVRWRNVYDTPEFTAAVSGGTTTIAARGGYVVNTNAAVLATHTVTLPSGASAVSGDKVIFATNNTITALTVNAGAATVNNAPTTLLAGTSFEFVYNDGAATWYRVR